MRNDLSNTCKRTLYNGRKRPKKKYKTPDDAIKACMKINSQKKQISKVVSYRCSTCGHYHVGKTDNKLSKSDKKDAKQWLKFYG